MGRIMVDELVFPFRGRMFCHLTADDDAELEAFARRIGLSKSWKHTKSSTPHYDLTQIMRGKAMSAGAVFVPALQQARERRVKRTCV